MSNGTKCRKRSCCWHERSHAGKPVLLFSAHVDSEECACTVLSLIIITNALQLNDPPDKGLWGGLVGGQGCWIICTLSMSWGEMGEVLTHITSDLAWSQSLKQPEERGIERVKKSKEAGKKEAKRSKCFLPGSLFPVLMTRCCVYPSLVTLDDLLLLFYRERDTYSHTQHPT